MSDAFTVLAGIVALAAPVFAGPAGPYEAKPALALHDTVEAGASRSIAVAYRDGEAITQIGVDRLTLPREDLPDGFVNALIAVEDASFTRHMGVDPTGIGRAVFGIASGNDSGGGSTLTQQFVKNTLSGARRTYERKIEEAIAAVMTESISTKDEFSKSYANVVFFGRRAEGAEPAARNWFGREWTELTLPQNAFLAGVLQAPSALDPLRSPERAKSRRDHVLGRMAQMEQITQAELEQALATSIDVIPPIPLPEATPALHDADFWAISDARRFLRGDNFLALAGEEEFRVTLDKTAQELGQAALDTMLANLNRVTGYSPLGNVSGKIGSGQAGEMDQAWREARRFVGQLPEGSRRIIIVDGRPVAEPGPSEPAPTAETSVPRGARDGDVYVMLADGTIRGRPRVQGALVAIDVGTGAPIASVGGTGSWASAFDRTRANRQPGSSIKPFLWLAALEAGFGPEFLRHELARHLRGRRRDLELRKTTARPPTRTCLSTMRSNAASTWWRPGSDAMSAFPRSRSFWNAPTSTRRTRAICFIRRPPSAPSRRRRSAWRWGLRRSTGASAISPSRRTSRISSA